MNNEIITWDKVRVLHKVVAGINTRKGLAVSLLCNPNSGGKYINSISAKKIEYRVDNRTQNHGILGLIRAVEEKAPVVVFEKVGLNQWRNLGNWVPTEIVEEPEIGAVKFVLRPYN